MFLFIFWSTNFLVVASGNTGPALANVLDRFQRGTAATTSSAARGNLSFRMRLVGCEERAPQAFVSPYTGRYWFCFVCFFP